MDTFERPENGSPGSDQNSPEVHGICAWDNDLNHPEAKETKEGSLIMFKKGRRSSGKADKKDITKKEKSGILKSAIKKKTEEPMPKSPTKIKGVSNGALAVGNGSIYDGYKIASRANE